MERSITVRFEQDKISDKDMQKFQQVIQKSLAKYFKKGWNIEATVQDD